MAMNIKGVSSPKPTGILGALQNMSPEMRMGLLQAGLGILANNTGHYGAAGPAIGRGGLLGAQGYQDAVKLKLLKDQQEAMNKYREDSLGLERDKFGFELDEAERERRLRAGRANYGAAPSVGGSPVAENPVAPPQQTQPVVEPRVGSSMFNPGAPPNAFDNGPQIGAIGEIPQRGEFSVTSGGMESFQNYGTDPNKPISQPTSRIARAQEARASASNGGMDAHTKEISKWKAIAEDARSAGDTDYEKIALEQVRNNQLALKEQVNMRKAEYDMNAGRMAPISGTTGFFRSNDPEGNFTGLWGVGKDGQPYLVSTDEIYAKELEKAEKGATKVIVGPEQKAYLGESGKIEAGVTEESRSAAQAAYKNSAALERFIENSDTAQGGLLQPVFSFAQNFFASFGFDAESLKSVDDMRSALNSILESKMEQFGARGLTDQDMKILSEELPKINTSKSSRVNVARIMQKAFDNDIREYDNRLRQEKELYPDKAQFIPSWLKSWRTRAVPQSAIDAGLSQDEWDTLTPEEKRVFK